MYGFITPDINSSIPSPKASTAISPALVTNFPILDDTKLFKALLIVGFDNILLTTLLDTVPPIPPVVPSIIPSIIPVEAPYCTASLYDAPLFKA